MAPPVRKLNRIFPARQLLTDKGLVDNTGYNKWVRTCSVHGESPVGKNNVEREPNGTELAVHYLMLSGEVLWIVVKAFWMMVAILILLFSGIRIGGQR